MRYLPGLMLATLALVAVPARSQWCEVVPDPFPPDAEEKALAPEPGLPVLDVLALVAPGHEAFGDIGVLLGKEVAAFNQALALSEVPGTVRLVGILPAPSSLRYDTGSAGATLDELLANPEARKLRDDVGADVVTLIAPHEAVKPYAGIAFLSNHEGAAYSVLSVNAVLNNPWLLAHEVGHNLGLVHDVANATSGGPYAPRAYGHWGAFDDGTTFNDIMAYQVACFPPRICSMTALFYSNPEITYRGARMGVPGQEEAALVLREDAFRRGSQYRKAKVAGTCLPGPTTLCLNNGRFRVEAEWETSDGGRGVGQATTLSSETGYFSFFSPGNVEVILKVLDGCGVNRKWWVFLAGLTNVEVTLTVTDTVSGTAKSYTNRQGQTFKPVLDVDAFATCE